MKEEKIEVKGMFCEKCQKAVESAVKSLDGVKEVKVDLKAGEVDVKFDQEEVELTEIEDEIRAAGYEVK
ncbi:heavy-metal-associated domain-containing protein [Orenia marismortui]|uniref:Copper chaperone CopZ n=1 Tax=Orenia marismortui TaxID=46469 RepID=A0A4V3GYH2_9FIRM|nr:heavy metal-associated domain-containing protein [Orenia marismortui]TDX52504.1 copper chaperone [Orenia marismortui]